MIPIEIDGQTKSAVEWARVAGITPSGIRKRIGAGYSGRDLLLPREALRGRNNKGNRTHGLKNHPMYRRWQGIKDRCRNPNSISYKWYGAVGIDICDEWADDFPAFLKGVGECPAPGMSLDRENPYKGYEPGNVRWATPLQQRHNRRS